MPWARAAVAAISTLWTWTGIPAALLVAMPTMARLNDPAPRSAS
jgi:hypothetical protein